jgi:hypothetical protein
MTEIFQEKEDWNRILDDLAEAGYSVYRVAQMLGHKWDTVKAWRVGDPKHADGKALLVLHARVCKVRA